MKAGAVQWLRRFTRAPCAHFLCMMLVPLACAAAPETKLTTAQIRTTLGGHHVTDGRHWGHDYHLDGRLERSENGSTSSGRWSAQNNQLCLLLPEVSKVSRVCFDVVRVGGGVAVPRCGQCGVRRHGQKESVSLMLLVSLYGVCTALAPRGTFGTIGGWSHFHALK